MPKISGMTKTWKRREMYGKKDELKKKYEKTMRQ